jgi:cobalt-zinc-cadmium efflux system membrane fusion protein
MLGEDTAMRARILQLFRSAISLLPTLAVLGTLAALAVVGHLSEWKISEVAKLWKRADSAGELDSTKQNSSTPSTTEASGVRFASAEALERSGIKTATVIKRPMSQSVVANGTLDYDRTRMAHLSTRAPGSVWKVYRRVGEPVHQGEILGLVDAAEVGRAKAEFLEALRALQLKTQNLELQKRADASGAVSERTLRESEAAVAEARIRLFSAQQALANLGLPIRTEEVSTLPDDRLTAHLRFLGLPESITRSLDPATTTANLLPLVAPFEGVVIRSDMVVGEVVSSAPPQFTVADLRRLWVMLDVHQEDIAHLRKGQRIAFRADGAPDLETAGMISWISTEVDDKTRTVRVRAEVENAGGQLRARSFGTGRILVAEEPGAIAVPSAALQWRGRDALVFVRQDDGLSFEPRPVRVGLRDGDYTEIVEGVRLGEIVATTGSHMLRSQLFLNESGEKD